MSLKTWWQTKNRKAKTITTLAVLIILNTGLCFLIPTATEWAEANFHRGGTDSYQDVGIMVLQALMDVLLVLALICVAIFWRPGRSSPDAKESHD
jgi:hypothetical protein